MGVKDLIKKSVALMSALAMSFSMITMPASSVFAEESSDGLQLSKNIELQEDGNYKITLEAYATGKDTTTTIQKAVPLDIVLVLDQSGSMADDFTSNVTYNPVSSKGYSYNDYKDKEYYYQDGDQYYKVLRGYKEEGFLLWKKTYYYLYYTKDGTDYYLSGTDVTTTMPKNITSGGNTIWTGVLYIQTSTTTRLAALKSAVTNFVTTVEENAVTNKVDHRIAMVGFASESEYGDNTEVLSVSGSNSESVGVKYNSTEYKTATQNAFQDTTTNAGKRMLTNAIDALAANGATRTDLGMTMANDILNADTKKDEAGRKKLVIMFTDGTPTSWDTFDSEVADSAINTSKTIKTSGKVYTIGIFDGADPTSLRSNENKFMNYVSTNYPNALSMDNPGTSSNTGYYKAASNADELNSIFESISNSETSSSTTVTLNGKSVLRDIISDKFELSEKNESSSVKVYTADSKAVDSNGTVTWKDKVEQSYSVSISGKTVDVSGFDYSQNYVTANHPGKKLIVEILVNGSYSGKQLDSNNAASGIYENKDAITAVKNFEQPKVDIPEYSYVLDYGKKVVLPNEDTNTKNVYDSTQTKNYSTTTMMNLSKAAPTDSTELKDDYGTFKLENSTLTYQPGKINWDGFDSIFTFGTKSDNSYEWYKTNVIPATSVYYEDDFGSFTTENPNTDSEVSIVWGGNWSSATDDLAEGENSKEDNNQQYDNKQYGWDSSYSDDNKFSNGSAHVTNDINATATFTFTGTGVDVYSKTDGDVGLIMAQLYKKGSNSAIKTFFIDNISVSGEYYQIPTLSFKDLDYGTYKVVIRAGGIGSGGGTTYYLDGIRVYNPLGVAPTDSVVSNAYTQAGEYNATFKEIRDILLDASNFTSDEIDESGNIKDNVIFDKDGAVFIDQVKDDEGNGTNSVETNKIGIYKDYGPKNEVYLASGQSIAFEINSGYTKLFVGAKSPTGNSTNMTITDGDTTKGVKIEHSSDMYYEINAKDSTNSKKIVVIKNTGTKLLSITKLRATGEGYTMSLTSSPELMNYINTFSSLSVSKTDESGMVIKSYDTDVDIDNDTNANEDENDKEESSQNSSSSIWQQVVSSIKNWFKR